MYPVGFSIILPFDLKTGAQLWAPHSEAVTLALCWSYVEFKVHKAKGMCSPRARAVLSWKDFTTKALGISCLTLLGQPPVPIRPPSSKPDPACTIPLGLRSGYLQRCRQAWTKQAGIYTCLCAGSERPSARIGKKSRSGYQ